MLCFVKINKLVGYVIVYVYDCFFRMGMVVGVIIEDFKNCGIKVSVVMQEVDNMMMGGMLQEDMLFMFLKFDN